MSSIKFVLNRSGVRELLKSAEMNSIIQEYANDAYNRLPSIDGYEVERRDTSQRVRYVVFANDWPALADNLKNNTILKVIR